MPRSDRARELLGDLLPASDRDTVSNRLGKTRELMQLAGAGESVPVSEMPDVRKALSRARPQGSVLDTASVLQVGLIVQTFRRVRQFFLPNGKNDVPFGLKPFPLPEYSNIWRMKSSRC